MTFEYRVRPIAEAPRDREILAYFPDSGWLAAQFREDDKVNNPGGWGVGFDFYESPPTFWTELPPDLSTIFECYSCSAQTSIDKGIFRWPCECGHYMYPIEQD